MSNDKNVDDLLKEWGDTESGNTRREFVTPQNVVDTLNKLYEMDKDAVQGLTDYRVACNEAITGHPTVQVGNADIWRKARPDLHLSENAEHTVGLIGILNGFFGMNENRSGPIAGVYQDVCDTCHEELNRLEDKGIKLGSQCPKCNKGIVTIGPLSKFKNLWTNK